MKLILARDSKGGVGLNNTLPWPSCKEDMKWFKSCTSGNTIVMGRNTFESLGSKPLPNRSNIVITSEPHIYKGGHLLKFMTLGEFIKNHTLDDMWLIGGAILAKTLMKYVEEAYITEVVGEYKCDTFFDYDFKDKFKLVGKEDLNSVASVYKYKRRDV